MRVVDRKCISALESFWKKSVERNLLRFQVEFYWDLRLDGLSTIDFDYDALSKFFIRRD